MRRVGAAGRTQSSCWNERWNGCGARSCERERERERERGGERDETEESQATNITCTRYILDLVPVE